MFEESRDRRELIIAITLAETFLLLVFLVWYVSPAGELPDWKTTAEQRQKEIERLRLEIARLKRQIEKLNQWWQTNWGVDCPASKAELLSVLRTREGKAILAEAGRGYPPCEESNVLIEAEVRHGAVRAVYGAAAETLQNWLRSQRGGRRLDEPPLEDWESVTRIATLAREFYAWRARLGAPCRFDYNLKYLTKEDYHDGRVLLEANFYPAAIRRVLR